MQTILGKIKTTIFHSTTGFFVGLFKVKEVKSEELKDLENKTITITGVLLEPNEEEIYALTGSYQRHDRGHGYAGKRGHRLPWGHRRRTRYGRHGRKSRLGEQAARKRSGRTARDSRHAL